jgi:CCR4-NOT transcription complex subunit 2
VPGPSKAAAFSDETLFFMFYSSPRDALQEVAAQELYVFVPSPSILSVLSVRLTHSYGSWNRNWRYHKDLRLWITKESGTTPSQKVQGGESGQYTYWDPENWIKERKEMTVLYSDLEEKSQPAFAQGSTLTPAAPGTQQQTQVQQQQSQVQTNPRQSFQQMGIAGL